MALVYDGLKMRMSVWKAPAVPPMLRYASSARSGVASRTTAQTTRKRRIGKSSCVAAGKIMHEKTCESEEASYESVAVATADLSRRLESLRVGSASLGAHRNR